MIQWIFILIALSQAQIFDVKLWSKGAATNYEHPNDVDSITFNDAYLIKWKGTNKVQTNFTSIDSITFLSYGQLVDAVNAKTYKTIKIGNQTWMAQALENKNSKLSYKLMKWNDAVALSFCKDTVKKPFHQGACPKGWHIPSLQEWDTLALRLGGRSVAAKKMQLKSGTYSDGNSSGFSAELNGFYNDYMDFYGQQGKMDCFWSTQGDVCGSYPYGGLAIKIHINFNGNYSSALEFNSGYSNDGCSVRCVQD